MSGYSNSSYSVGGADREDNVVKVGQGKTVALDFDGTLHPYTDGWTGSVPDNEPPIPGSLSFIQGLLDAGYTCIIFSTRADHDEGRIGIEQWLAKWYGAVIAQELRVTHVKVGAVAYVDDRAVPFSQATLNWAECRARIDELAQGRAHGAAQVEATS